MTLYLAKDFSDEIIPIEYDRISGGYAIRGKYGTPLRGFREGLFETIEAARDWKIETIKSHIEESKKALHYHERRLKEFERSGCVRPLVPIAC